MILLVRRKAQVQHLSDKLLKMRTKLKQLQERLEEAAAATQEVAIPDPIDGEMDDPEFEQAIIDLRDPIRELRFS